VCRIWPSSSLPVGTYPIPNLQDGYLQELVSLFLSSTLQPEKHMAMFSASEYLCSLGTFLDIYRLINVSAVSFGPLEVVIQLEFGLMYGTYPILYNAAIIIKKI
jgi:hypothetical protein